MLADVQQVVDNSALSLKGIDDIDGLEVRLAELGPATEAQLAVARAVLGLRRAQILAEKERKARKIARLETKRKGVLDGNSNKLLQGVVGAGERAREQDKKRELGVNPENWMDWAVSIRRSLILTASCIAKMLSLVVVFSFVTWGLVLTVRMAIGDEWVAEMGNRDATLLLIGLEFCGFTLFVWLIQMNVHMTYIRSYLILPLPVLVMYLIISLYFETSGAKSMDNKVTAGLGVLSIALMGGVFGFSLVSEAEDVNQPIDILHIAKGRAKAAIEEGGRVPVEQKKSVLGKAKIGVILAFPNFFILGVMALLAVGIFALFKVSDSTWWKLVVTLIALGIKIGGNKMLLGIVGGLAP
jgi:hypothetical protein